ncbi:lateral flagellin LafA [Gallaecimonas pentaromativorans]|uniref:Flagellin n=1 Tax=Gallaecimonas pentaromativorans TaxID=584787 RepID=A0A3N1PBE4_9GAMM|nr:lateral flagellin LafA [Gallaecimonas pentaromativorans]MED5526545.1 lateral flagellin LafA [Pseudomonadota bacterium]ROQ25883.1 flagellin [Gallaecimonas pentaromativorans]
MALSIQTNFASLVAQNSLTKNNNMLSTAMQRLGTGLRVNSAADDAAGLQIANRLTAQTRGMAVAQRNSQDAISMLQTADSSLDEASSIVFRMKDLATQAANGTNGTSDISAMDSEYGELKNELTRIMTKTTYGSGQTLLSGGKLDGAVNFQIGASSSETLAFDGSAEIGAITTAQGSLVDLTTSATAEMGSLDTLQDAIGAARAKFGANINRLDHTINNLASISQNTDAAKGRIMDADFASETSNMTKQQLLMQTGVSVLSNANSVTSLVGSLLR